MTEAAEPFRKTMDRDPGDDLPLARFRAELVAAYGERLHRVVLFGSRARGDSRPDSDYDVAVFIRDAGSRWNELGRLADISAGILMDTGALISAKPFASAEYDKPRPLMNEIRRDGRELRGHPVLNESHSTPRDGAMPKSIAPYEATSRRDYTCCAAPEASAKAP